MSTQLEVNGKQYKVEVDPDKPLLWVLREDLDLPGTKFGCGAGLCGACTVHLAATPVRSCITPLAAVEDQPVTTIEGVAALDAGRCVGEAWRALDAPQCGYCQAGQIMSAVALLTENPWPDDAAVDAAMSGNLCRCSTYVRIRAGIKTAALARSAAA